MNFTEHTDSDAPWPEQAVEVGVVTGAWGVQGGLRIKPHSADPQALFATKRWYWKAPQGAVAALQQQLQSALEQPLRVSSAREQGEGLVARIHELEDRDLAQACRGLRLFVPRSSFPTASEGEYYWVDLIGLQVLNRQQQVLGTVTGLMQTGPHSVLRIAPAGEPAAPQEVLVPFVDAYVDAVDLAARTIRVDWDAQD